MGVGASHLVQHLLQCHGPGGESGRGEFGSGTFRERERVCVCVCVCAVMGMCSSIPDVSFSGFHWRTSVRARTHMHSSVTRLDSSLAKGLLGGYD